VLVMTSAFSNFIQARMLPSRTTPDLIGGMWALLQDAQAVPSRLLWDNESGIGRRKPTEPVAAFAGSLWDWRSSCFRRGIRSPRA
jgi:hypothetical protein